jgi:phage terminase large subunit-like protein
MKCEYIDNFLLPIARGEKVASKEMLAAVDYIYKTIGENGIDLHVEKTAKAISLMEKYFKYQLFPWEKCEIALMHAEYPDSSLVFNEFFTMMGRGNGKNGFISPVAWYLTTKYHGVDGYNVDIIANSEDQAKTSFFDVYGMLERTAATSKKWFRWNRTEIINRNTGSYIKYNTSNANTKDGKRSGCLIVDEEHAYESSEALGTFQSGFGKVPHSRTFKITTNGYVRDGVLDKDLEIARDVLKGKTKGLRLCPLIFKIDGEEEADNPEMWEKANPSLPYLPDLKFQIEQENIKRKTDARTNLEFMTKRMNFPKTDMELAVTEWENIAATNRPLPNMDSWLCTVGIDYASMRDWAAVLFHFKRGKERFDICHSWLCVRNPELFRIRAPWREWAASGMITPVDAVEIAPELLTDYIREMGKTYAIQGIALDGFRYALMRTTLAKIGFDADTYDNIKLVRPSDVMRIQPIIDSCFNKQLFCWGDNPVLRWATNNTMLIPSAKKNGVDTGNFIYAKIEAKSRKTDPFMALVAAMTIEDLLGDSASIDQIKVFSSF